MPPQPDPPGELQDGTCGKGNSAAPEWFRNALATPSTTRIVQSTVPVAVRRWGGDGGAALVLVHGAAAHSGWWAHVAPMLADNLGPVVALDLGGNGASGWRSAYSLDSWADDIDAVVRAECTPGHAVVIGHSLGGVIALTAAARASTVIGGCVLVDSILRSRTARSRASRARRASRPTLVYPTAEEAFAAFRPIPAADRTLSYVRAAVAASSVRQVEGGVTWCFDPRIFARPDIELFPAARVPVAVVRPELGLVDDAQLAAMRDRFAVRAVVNVPGAGHHAMLDRPLELVDALRTAVGVV